MQYHELRTLMSDPVQVAIIQEKTKFLGDDKKIPIRQRIWHIESDIFFIPVCDYCNKNTVKWSTKNQKYSRYCSNFCSTTNPKTIKKREETCMVKYGHKSNLSNQENIAKQQATCLEKYGTDNFAKTAEFKKKYQATCLEKYGVKNTSQIAEVKEKIDQTHLDRYGRKRQSQQHISQESIDAKNNVELMREWFETKKMPISEIAEILNVGHSQLCIHFEKNLGIDISRHSVSTNERKIADYLTDIGVDFETSNRTVIKPKEIDIYAKSHQVGIELHGLAWHCELRGKSNGYHLEKMQNCNQQGVRLVQILDSEWILKQEIVKSRLSGIFGKNRKIGARQCSVVQLSPSQASAFFDQTHIQGACIHSLCLGLEHQGQIVAAMSFGKCRFNKNFQWELIRYSNCLFTNVIGGGSRLFSHFVKIYKPQSVISYCDLRWNTGHLYEKLGFEKQRQTGPNYWYTLGYRQVESRLRYQKHKLSKLLKTFDPNLTEWQNMQINGYDRFWDCGNLVFIWGK